MGEEREDIGNILRKGGKPNTKEEEDITESMTFHEKVDKNQFDEFKE